MKPAVPGYCSVDIGGSVSQKPEVTRNGDMVVSVMKRNLPTRNPRWVTTGLPTGIVAQITMCGPYLPGRLVVAVQHIVDAGTRGCVPLVISNYQSTARFHSGGAPAVAGTQCPITDHRSPMTSTADRTREAVT